MGELEMENKAKQIFMDESEMVGCLESIRDQIAEKLEDAPNDNHIVNIGKDINNFTTFINIIRAFCNDYEEISYYPMPTQKEYKNALKKMSKGKSRVKKIVKQNDFNAIKIFNAFVEVHNENMKFINCNCTCEVREGVIFNGTIQA